MIQTRQMGFRKAADFFSVSNAVYIYKGKIILKVKKILLSQLKFHDLYPKTVR